MLMSEVGLFLRTEVPRKIVGFAKRNFHSIIALSLIVLTVLVVYWQDLVILFNEAVGSDAMSHIFFVPFLVSYLFYRKREVIKAHFVLNEVSSEKPVSVNFLVGIMLCLTAFLVYWYGSYTFYPLEFHVASLVLFVAGVVLALTSFKLLLALIFPVLFLAFLVFPPSVVAYEAGAIVAYVNTQGSYALLKAAGLPVSLSYNYGAPIISLSTASADIEFAVYQASSGIYSLIAFTMFATFIVYIMHGPLVKKIGVFLLGMLLLPVLNIIRISVIVSVALWLGEEIAMNVFHTFAGWILIFVGTLLLLLIGEKLLHLRLTRDRKEALCPECIESSRTQAPFCLNCGKLLHTARSRISKVLWAKVMGLLIGALLVTVSLQAPAFAFAPGFTVSSSDPQSNTSMFPEVPEHQLRFLYRDETYERVAHQDVSLVYVYSPENYSTLPIYVIVGVASSISNLHNWEVSLIAWQTSRGQQPLVSLIDSADFQLTENPRIVARFLVFEHPSNWTYVAVYWHQRAPFNTGLTVEPRYVRINLLVLTRNQEDWLEIKDRLQTVGESIAVYWEPLRVQSLFSLAIPLQQLLLASTASAAVIAQVSQYALNQKRKKTNTQIFIKLASSDDKLLLQAVRETNQKTREATSQAVASTLTETANKSMKLNRLDAALRTLEKSGIIKADLVNMLDQPKLVWTS